MTPEELREAAEILVEVCDGGDWEDICADLIGRMIHADQEGKPGLSAFLSHVSDFIEVNAE